MPHRLNNIHEAAERLTMCSHHKGEEKGCLFVQKDYASTDASDAPNP